MSVTAEYIRSKEIALINNKYYSADQVDDFLDELANEVGGMNTEAAAQRDRVAKLEAELAKAQEEAAALKAAAAVKPEYDEDAYFKDLQKAIHEALTGARRVADEALNEAKRTAEETKAAADTYATKTRTEADALAKTTLDEADKKVSELNAKAEELAAKNKEYLDNFRKLVQGQLDSLA